MLNLNINWPRVALACLFLVVAAGSFFLRLPQYSFIIDTSESTVQHQSNSPILSLSQVKMLRFNEDGSKHSTLYADTVKQLKNDDKYYFEQPKLQLASKQAWTISATAATADTEQKEVLFAPKVLAKNGNISIKTPALTVFHKTQTAYSDKGIIMTSDATRTTAAIMTVFFEQPQILLNKQVKTSYVPTSDS